MDNLNINELKLTQFKDYINPTKEEISEEIKKLNALLVYFAQARATCQLLVSSKEEELDQLKRESRDRYDMLFNTERESKIALNLKTVSSVSNSNVGKMVIPSFNPVIQKIVQSKPTEKDYEDFLNKDKYYIAARKDYNIYISRLERFADISYILNKRYVSIMEIAKKMEQEQSITKRFARN